MMTIGSYFSVSRERIESVSVVLAHVVQGKDCCPVDSLGYVHLLLVKEFYTFRFSQLLDGSALDTYLMLCEVIPPRY